MEYEKWYLFYSSSDMFLELARTIEDGIGLNSLKLQQVGAEISENQKLHQAGAEIEFPAIFGFISLSVGYDEEELEDALE